MSRELKFRAWSAYHNKMIYSDQCLNKPPELKNIMISWMHTEEFRFERDGSIRLWLHEYMTPPANATVIVHQYHWVRDTEAVIMEFTGLNDREGNAIYERDIVVSAKSGKIGVVEWAAGIASFCVKYNGTSWALNEGKLGRSLDLAYTLVTGNIYQTPEYENKTQDT